MKERKEKDRNLHATVKCCANTVQFYSFLHKMLNE